MRRRPSTRMLTNLESGSDQEVGRMSGLSVEDLVFGCGPIGSYAADGDGGTGEAALRPALKGGITHFDVAPSYGDGQAEALLGAALRDREDAKPGGAIVVSTKVGRTAMANATPYARPLTPDSPRGGGAFDFSADGVKATLAEGMRRLGRERVDVVFVHDPDVAVEQARAEALPALAELRAAGVVGAIGVATTNPEVALTFVETDEVE